jgi:hypothetical protein
MPKVIDREEWILLGLRGLNEGKWPPGAAVPAKGRQASGEEGGNSPTIEEAGEILGVTRSSFNSYFGNIATYHAEICKRWAADKRAARERDEHQARGVIEEPVRRLRRRRSAAAATAEGDRMMRVWSATATMSRPVFGAAIAEEALEAERAPVLEATTADLADLGLSEDDAPLVARLLLPEFGLGPGEPSVPFSDEEGFDTLLAIFARSVREDLMTVMTVEVEGPPGSGPTTVMVVKGPGGKAVDPHKLAALAGQFASEIEADGDPAAAVPAAGPAEG